MNRDLLVGRLHVLVTDPRTTVDFAGQMKDLVDIHVPNDSRIVPILGNFNTHNPARPYATFRPDEASRMVVNLRVKCAPKLDS